MAYFHGKKLISSMSSKPCFDKLPQRSFGRVRSRGLRPSQQSLMRELLPKIRVTVADPNPQTHFPSATEIHLEIGYGGGERLAEMATRHPDHGFIGCEVFINGVASLLSKIAERNIPNLRLFTDDGRLLLDCLPDHSIDHIAIPFPDPWPKKRHHKKRIIQASLLPILARVLKPSGQIIIATDHAEYQSYIREILKEQKLFQCEETTAPEEWVVTRYQQKAIEAGRESLFFLLSTSS